jgi:squalene-hopene/tetraprenyl-beta-curcumene cyclase
MIDRDRLDRCYAIARDALLAERNADGFWVGELSSSALAGAVACIAFRLVDREAHVERIRAGIGWLLQTQNPDGGWGDTTKSFSNISTSMLIRAAFAICEIDEPAVAKLDDFLNEKCGRTPAERAEAIRNRYGTDRTFSVPILMTSALAGLVPWNEVPRLPFEAAYLPQSWYRFARMPVVSYALPALIAIGQCIHHFRPTWNPITQAVRWFTRKRTQRVLRRIQPSSGGYLEATPLTAFVCMSLASLPTSKRTTAANEVLAEGVRFLVESMRPDGSWPIDTNLSIWVTTLSVNALAAGNDLGSIPDKQKLIDWLLARQTKTRHPYTGAAPGGWGWSHCPGSVPDCDDTPGAVIALRNLGYQGPAIEKGQAWILGLQNGNGGFPTFCRGWGKLPFDRSGSDLTSHAMRALMTVFLQSLKPSSGFWSLKIDDEPIIDDFIDAQFYVMKQQRSDGSWLPLWFGNQHADDDKNPVYGTCRVLLIIIDLVQHYRSFGNDLFRIESERGVEFLKSCQNPDGGWGGNVGCPSSVEETSLVLEVLVMSEGLPLTPLPTPSSGEGNEATLGAIDRGLAWLLHAVESGRFREPAPIGFYFAKLWYFEKLYPLIFTVAALGATRVALRFDDLDHDRGDVVA